MFLQDTTNKEELFSLLTNTIKYFQSPENKEVNIFFFQEKMFSRAAGPQDTKMRPRGS